MFETSSSRSRLKRRVASALLRSIQLARILIFRWLSTNTAQGNPILHQPVQLVGNGRICFGENVHIGVFPSPYYLTGYAYLEARSPNACVVIGEGSQINNGFVAIAEHSVIRIGRNALVGTNVEIYDSDFHGLQLDQRKVSSPASARPVTIGDDVFIGSNVKILKGAKIGAGAVVANGSIVVGDIPERVVAGGLPARTLRRIE